MEGPIAYRLSQVRAAERAAEKRLAAAGASGQQTTRVNPQQARTYYTALTTFEKIKDWFTFWRAPLGTDTRYQPKVIKTTEKGQRVWFYQADYERDQILKQMDRSSGDLDSIVDLPAKVEGYKKKYGSPSAELDKRLAQLIAELPQSIEIPELDKVVSEIDEKEGLQRIFSEYQQTEESKQKLQNLPESNARKDMIGTIDAFQRGIKQIVAGKLSAARDSMRGHISGILKEYQKDLGKRLKLEKGLKQAELWVKGTQRAVAKDTYFSTYTPSWEEALSLEKSAVAKLEQERSNLQALPSREPDQEQQVQALTQQIAKQTEAYQEKERQKVEAWEANRAASDALRQREATVAELKRQLAQLPETSAKIVQTAEMMAYARLFALDYLLRGGPGEGLHPALSEDLATVVTDPLTPGIASIWIQGLGLSH